MPWTSYFWAGKSITIMSNSSKAHSKAKGGRYDHRIRTTRAPTTPAINAVKSRIWKAAACFFTVFRDLAKHLLETTAGCSLPSAVMASPTPLDECGSFLMNGCGCARVTVRGLSEKPAYGEKARWLSVEDKRYPC